MPSHQQILSYADIKVEAHKRLKSTTMLKLYRFISKKKTRFWGLKKTNSWENKAIYLYLYNWMYNIDYINLSTGIASWYPVAATTLSVNANRWHILLRQWAKTRIKRIILPEWKLAVRNQSFPKSQETQCLWNNSCDFELIGKKKNTKEFFWLVL